MKRLLESYYASWSSRCRGALRTAYTMDGDDIVFRKDFLRFVDRMMVKEDPMILKRTIETDHLTIYIFRKDAENVSAVRAVAQVIAELGDGPEGVSNAAINFAIPGKPLSGGQRFRELCAAYRRQWPGVMIDKFQDAMIAVDLVKAGSHLVAAMQGCSPDRQSHVYKNNRYHFTGDFLSWISASLPEIEKVVYPVTSRKKIFDLENA